MSPQVLTLLALGSRDAELAELSNALNHRLTGEPVHDGPILLNLNNVFAERAQIASRRAAITSGGTFTPPSSTDVTNLQTAITAVHSAVMASANANVLITLGTNLLNEYGAARSR